MSSDMPAHAVPRRPADAGERIPSGLFFGLGPSTWPILRWVGIGLTAVAVVYFFVHVVKNISEITSLDWDISNIATVAVIFGLYGTTLAAFPVAWYMLLRGTKETPRFPDVLAISLISQFAKYIPGNVAQHVGRVALAHAYGLNVPRVVVTMVVETGWVIFAGTAICAILILAGVPVVLGIGPSIPGIWVIAFAGVAAALAPLAGARLLERWRPGPLRRLLEEGTITLPSSPILLSCFVIYVGNYLLMGAILYIIATQGFGLENVDYWLLTGIFAVAWVVGFIAPGAPGGLGVREAILVAALGPLFGGPTAVAIAITLRGISTFGDGFGFLLGLVVQRAGQRPAN